MAQTGYTPISLYYSTTASQAPTAGNLANGELAINITDGKLYYKDNTGTVKVIAGSGGTGIVAGSNTQIQFNNNGVFGASSGMTWDGTNLTASQLRSSGLTSGRVTYASTSGLLVDSANMTFNGTVLTVNTLSLTNALSTANGGTGVTSFTANRVFYASSTSTLNQSANLTFDGTTLVAANFTDSSLTSGRVTYAGTGGNLTDSANLTYDGSTLTVIGGASVVGTTPVLLQRPVIPSFAGQGAPAIQWQFYSTGTTYTTGAYIQALADAAWSSTSAPTSLRFYTVPSGSTTAIETMRNDASGMFLDTGAGGGRMTFLPGNTFNQILSTTTGFGAYNALRHQATAYQWLNGSGTQVATIDTSGNFLVGATGGTPGRLGISGIGGSSSPDVVIDSNSTYSEIQSYNNKPLYINRQGNNVIINTPSGSVGVGTATPGAKVHIDLVASSGAGLIVGYATQTASQVNLGIGVLSANRPFVGTNSSSNELEIGTMANVAMRFVTNGAIRGYMSTLGSLGIGVEPGANHGNSGIFASGQASAYTAISMGASGNGYGVIGYGIGFTGTAGEYKSLVTDNLSWIRFQNGQIEFWNQMSAQPGTTYTGTRNALFATNGDLLIGTNSSSGKLTVVTGNNNQAGYFQSGSGTTQQAIASFANSTNSGYLSIAGVGTSSVVATWNNGAIVQEAVPASSGNYFIGAFTNDIVFQTAGRTNRGRITSGGYFVFGADTSAGFGSVNRIAAIGSQGNFILSIDGGTEYSMFAQAVNGANYSATDCAQRIGRNTSTLRSINAGGTINASGADYAEYMTKAGDFTIAKGDVCGVNADGKLTNVFADAISFVVKSTDPSYVGGDTWGSQETIGRKAPRPPAEGATEQEMQKYASDKAEYDALVEAARQNVDRVAFAGQVPVNVMGATPGQYIIPVNDNGAIKGMAVSNPTFEQYQVAVGKVIAVESDGRAKIIVKVA